MPRDLSAALAYIALGSNLGPRAQLLLAAIRRLETTPGLQVLARSRWYETAPEGGPPGQGAYLNGVCALSSQLEPRALLERCLEIEAELGRERRLGIANAPRTLDLDLLIYAGRKLEEPGLCVPHPRLEQRAFVVEPLAEIAPNLALPSGLSASERLAQFDVSERGRAVEAAPT